MNVLKIHVLIIAEIANMFFWSLKQDEDKKKKSKNKNKNTHKKKKKQ